jgi:hypothetical protein
MSAASPPAFRSCNSPAPYYSAISGINGIDLKVEFLVPLTQVPKLPFMPVRAKGKRFHQSTVFRWVQKGVRGVKLEIVQAAGTKCTSVEAISRFFERVGQVAGGGTTAVSSRKQQLDRACQRLNSLLNSSR